MEYTRYIYLIFSSVFAIQIWAAPNSKELSLPKVLNKSIVIYENFESGNKGSDSNSKGKLFLNSSSVVLHGNHGGVLSLEDNTYAKILPSEKLYANEGTVSFWVKPRWDKSEKRSQTFLSMRWKHDKKSYMAISQGWWEPIGQERLYFILSNEEYIHCSIPYAFEINEWSMITAVWKGGEEGYCKLYVNDEKIVEYRSLYLGDYMSEGPIYIGSDKGATDQRGRDTKSLIDDLLVLNIALKDKEVAQHYWENVKDQKTAFNKKWRWLNEGLKLPLQQNRNKDGILLESRVIFDEEIHWASSKDTADKILKRISDGGFNVYVPCVWHGKGTYYPTPLTKIDSRLKDVINDEYDPLAYLIKKAHSMGIEVHPWFTVVRRENSLYPEFYSEGVPAGAYDVHNQQFRDFIIRLMLDVVARYDIDGLNLDYIRTMGICMSIKCKVDYQEKTGYSLMADLDIYISDRSARSRIQNWQDNAVGNIIVNISLQSRSLKPNLVISIDDHPKPLAAKRDLQGRDGLRWANEGYIDVVFNMDYKKRIDYKMADAVRKDLNKKEKMTILLRNYDKIDNIVVPRNGDLIAKYIEFVRRRWPDSGVAVYMYKWLSNNQIKRLKEGPFREKALPNWPRKRIMHGIARGLQL